MQSKRQDSSASLTQSFLRLRQTARDFPEICRWFEQHGERLTDTNKTHSFFHKVFKRTWPLEKVDFSDVKYSQYFPGLGSPFVFEHMNKVGYSAQFTYEQASKQPHVPCLHDLEGLLWNCSPASYTRYGRTFIHRVFFLADQWPFISAHLIFDLLLGGEAKSSRLSRHYSTLNIGRTRLQDLLMVAPYENGPSQSALQLAADLTTKMFPGIGWTRLRDLVDAGLVPEGKQSFCNWLCQFVDVDIQPVKTEVLPSSLIL